MNTESHGRLKEFFLWLPLLINLTLFIALRLSSVSTAHLRYLWSLHYNHLFGMELLGRLENQWSILPYGFLIALYHLVLIALTIRLARRWMNRRLISLTLILLYSLACASLLPLLTTFSLADLHVRGGLDVLFFSAPFLWILTGLLFPARSIVPVKSWIWITTIFILLSMTPFAVIPILTPPAATKANPPNVILLLCDTLRYDAVTGFDGRQSIDAVKMMTRSGLSLSRTYAASDWTIPSTLSLFTGLCPHDHKQKFLDDKIDVDVPQLPLLLANGGYTTMAVQTNPILARWTRNVFEKNAFAWRADADYVTRSGREFLTDNSQPFFLYLHFMDVHIAYPHTCEDCLNGFAMDHFGIFEVINTYMTLPNIEKNPLSAA